MEDYFALLEACLLNETGTSSQECFKADEANPIGCPYTLECPFCKEEFPFDLDEPGTGESECPLCLKEIIIKWDWYPDGTETYWVNKPEDPPNTYR